MQPQVKNANASEVQPIDVSSQLHLHLSYRIKKTQSKCDAPSIKYFKNPVLLFETELEITVL